MKSIITPAIIIVALSTVAGIIFIKRHQTANELPAHKGIGIQLNDTTSSRRVDTLKQKNNSKIRIPKKATEGNKSASMVAFINSGAKDIPSIVEKRAPEMRKADSIALIAYPEPAAIVEMEQQTPEEPDENMLTASIASSPVLTEAGKKETSMRPRGKFFKFELFTPEGKVLPGVVHYVDIDRGVDIGAYKTDRYIDIVGPRGKKPMTTVCEIFGYKEIVKAIDYTNPSSTESAYQDEKGVWVIPYNLVPLEKGDVSIMNNVSFYKDAAVMLNDSKKDLTVLYNMMQANPDYVIKVHSYCNGKNKRLILVNNKDLFSSEGGTKYVGSAKDLTELRAEAIREYLANRGIDKNRVRIYPWGGRDMIVNEISPNAKFNDRVEIEVLKD